MSTPDSWTIPPDWVFLLDVPQWIERRFGVPGEPFIQSLVAALRRGEVVYRISGLDLERYTAPNSYQRPNGLRSVADQPPEQAIAILGLGQVDWQTGTITGAPKAGDHRIEAWWLDVENWASVRQEMFVLQTAKARNDPIPSINLEQSSKAKGGRPTQHKWDDFWIKVVCWAENNNLEPEKEQRPALRRHLLEWCSAFEKGPDLSQVDRKLRQLYLTMGRRKT